MDEVYSFNEISVRTLFEQYLIKAEELRLFVVYTYYDKLGKPLYVGRSKDFYNAHYFNSQRLDFFYLIEYCGFVFFESEVEIKNAKNQIIKEKSPQYNKLFSEVVQVENRNITEDDIVVNRIEMENFWKSSY